jgi:murein DD-endopeptidase MepM/ murein hydrolase activator NlpD
MGAQTMSQDSLSFGVIFTADNKELVAATRENVGATTGYVAAAKKADQALGDLARAQAVAKTGTDAARAAYKAGEVSLEQYNRMLLASKVNLSGFTTEHARAQKSLVQASGTSEQALRGQGRASVQLGQQLQDAAIQAQYGAGWFTILASQGSQAAYVLSQMDGGASKFKKGIASAASVVAGPWGIAIAAAIYGLSLLLDQTDKNAEAMAKLQPLTNSLADAQSTLGQMFDLTTGKLKNQNELLKINAQLLAVKLQAEGLAERSESKDVLAAGLNLGTRANQEINQSGGALAAINIALGKGTEVANAVGRNNLLIDTVKKVEKGQLAASDAFTNIAKLPADFFDGLKVNQAEFLEALGKKVSSDLKLKTASLINKSLEDGQLAPEFRKKEKEKKAKAERATAGDLTQFDYPFAASTITSGYGRRKPPKNGASSNHLALDFGAAEGTPIKAQVAGIVSFAGKAGGYGNQIQLNHGAGTQTRYSHLSRFGVKDGDRVEKGDTIGYVGKTGTATGAHLHYEVLVNGKKVDPSKKLFATDETAVADSAQTVFDQLEDFGNQAADRIAQVKGQFDTVPRDVDNASRAIDDINELMAELEKRQPPGFEAMIADAKKLAPLIKDSLRRPILDMLRDQDRQIGIGQALLENDQGRADAMQVTLQLMQRVGVENEAQLATELARRGITGDQIRDYYRQLDVLQDQGRALDVLRQKQEVNLQFLAEFQGGLRDSIRGILGGEGLSALSKGLDRIFEGYLDALADQLSETLFGDIFRKQQDKVTGVGPVKEAGEKLAIQVDLAKTQVSALVVEIDNTSAALGGLVDAIQGAANGLTTPPSAPPSTFEPYEPLPGEEPDQGIVVLADRDVAKTAKSTLQQLFEGLFGEDSPAAAQLAKIIPLLFQGAAEGQAASGILGSLGVKQSKLGAQIGGAAGKAIGTYFGGPLGAKLGGFIGGTIGGTIGGLFKKSKTGSASLSFVDGQLISGAVGGNNKKLQGRSGELIGGVGTSLTSIAEQLGGFLSGRAAVSIGYDKKGRVVVDPTGQNRTKGSGVKNFGKDGEEAARAFAVLDALKDGAVAGLSDKVAQALRSSDDLEKAIREAVKVDEIEQILNGFGGASKRVFVDFERQAKERLRVAGKYGFDMVKLEEENQKQRKKLLADSIEQATGGLKALLEDLISGAKAPGTLLDRRAALLARKTELEQLAPTDADAAAKLADVLEQLYQVSLEAFGTAGAQFAGDRSGIQSSAEAIIAAATAELTAAQEAARNGAGTDSSSTDRLIGSGNAVLTQIQQLTDENNSQSAEMIALLARIAESVRQGTQDSGSIGRAYDIGTMSF